MGDQSAISWTHRTWNPWQGCERVSPGCDHCYMFRDMRRYGKDPDTVKRSAAQTFNKPLRWQREAEQGSDQRLVFLASWSDFFIKDADAWRAEAFDIIRRCPLLTFQILTKRHGRIAANLPPDWGAGYPNVWLGVTAEDREWWDRRVAVLRGISARTKFVSYEPAIGSIAGASAVGIDWVIIGGESAPGRVFPMEWATEALEVCRRDGAAPWVKQMGSKPTSDLYRISHKGDDRPRPDGFWRHLNHPHGADPSEWPEALRVQELPK